MGLATRQQGIGLLLAVMVVAKGAHTSGIRRLRELAEVVVGIAARSGGVAVSRPQQQTAGGFVAMRHHDSADIGFGSKAVKTVVCFHYAAVVGVGFAQFQAGRGVKCPCCFISIYTFGGVGANNFRSCSEGLERNEIVRFIVTEANRLYI